MINKIGYACINTELPSPSRTCRKNTFLKKGYNHVAKLAWENMSRLDKVIDWNIDHGVKLFRFTSNLVPWKEEYAWDDLPNWGNLEAKMKLIGEKVRSSGMRVTFHPGPFNVLASYDDDVLLRTHRSLNVHGEIFDIMGFPQNHLYPINVHVGGAYNDKDKALQNFLYQWHYVLNGSVKKRLTLENDASQNLYSVADITNAMFRYKETVQIPIMYDFHHAWCRDGNNEPLDSYHVQHLWRKEAEIAYSTWPTGITPIFHWSESKALEVNDSKISPTAHSELCRATLPVWDDLSFDLMIEAKGKEKALYSLAKSNSGIPCLHDLR